MRICVFGMGYVGVVSAVCLARDGHVVIGVDPNTTKVDIVNSGQSPIIENQVDELLQSAVSGGQLSAITDPVRAVLESDISLICVGTPSQVNGSLDMGYVENVCGEIGAAMAQVTHYHTVVIRSTVLPGTLRQNLIPILESSSGKVAGKDFGVCNNPEFLREGSAIHDFDNPPKTVIGELSPGDGDTLATLYDKIDAPLIRTEIEVAELAKYVDNCWHALKVGFGNEIGRICKPLGIDSHKVMDIFLQDRKLNISEAYLRPGFAYGGSCLPKDLRALSYLARDSDVNVPILAAIGSSNEEQIALALRMIMRDGRRPIGLLGLSFKAGTDDLRESPQVELVEALIGKGYSVRIYDRNVNLAKLVGANRDFILHHIPHIAELLVPTMDEAIDFGEILVIGNGSDEFPHALNDLADKRIIDLVRLFTERTSSDDYEGISW